MNKINRTELLSPAGSFEALKQAIHNGADAVYLGGTQFGARAYANNFDDLELKKAVDYAHLYGVKIYVTVNTIIYENEIAEFREYINFLVSIGIDALIMQDIGMAYWVINSFDVPVHSSTQMHNYSLSNIEYLKNNGFDRAVAARETEIADITKMSDIMDTEVFVHGALCICYSGQCLFSAIEHDRSGNRGKCAQACRMKYSLYVDNNLIIEDKYLLSPKDLALLEDTHKIINANAKSLKLEGRMKSPEYVGFITKTYRNIIDDYYHGRQSKISTENIDKLKRLFNRGFTTGYIFGLDNSSLMTINRPNHAGVYIGDVISTDKKFITIKLHNPLHQGDGVKFDKADKGFVCNKIYFNGKLVSKGYPDQIIQLEDKVNLKHLDKLLLTKDTALLKSLENYSEKKIPIKIRGEFYIGKPCKIAISDNNGNIVSHEDAVVEQSKNAPLSAENITESLGKLGDTPYHASSIEVLKDDSIFISKSSINKLRRDAIKMLSSNSTHKIKYSKKKFKCGYSAPLPSPNYICCTVNNEEQLETILRHKVDRIYIRDYSLYEKYKAKNKNVYYFMDGLNGNAEKYINKQLIIRDTGGIKYAQNNTVMGDYTLNTANSYSLMHLHSRNLQSVCLSVELDDNIIKKLISNYKQAYSNLPNVEILVYGYIQLMTTKHCILEGNIKCGNCKTSNIYLSDIKGNNFPLTTDSKCNNNIYSKAPVNKIDKIQYFKSIGVNGFRLDFLHESTEEIDMILYEIV